MVLYLFRLADKKVNGFTVHEMFEVQHARLPEKAKLLISEERLRQVLQLRKFLHVLVLMSFPGAGNNTGNEL